MRFEHQALRTGCAGLLFVKAEHLTAFGIERETGQESQVPVKQ